jgi:hypothetical protein
LLTNCSTFVYEAVTVLKPTKMKALTFVICSCCVLWSACDKNDHSNRPLKTLHGLYTETSPYAGRSQLDFISDKLVVRSEPGSVYRDTFMYTISDKKLALTIVTGRNNYQDGNYTFDADYQALSANEFKIQNLYPQIPENPESFMVYAK